MTLLEIVQAACKQIGIPVPTQVISNSDAGIEQLLQLVQQTGKELVQEHSWRALKTVVSFAGVASQVQTGALASDFERFVPNTELWNVTTRRVVCGVSDDSQWLHLTVENLASAVEYWSLIGGEINILPVTSASNTYRYMYITKNWVMAEDGITTKSSYTADSDYSRVSCLCELITLGAVWRWKHAKGLDYAEDFITFERKKEKAIGDDRGPHVISTARNPGFPANIWPWAIG